MFRFNSEKMFLFLAERDSMPPPPPPPPLLLLLLLLLLLPPPPPPPLMSAANCHNAASTHSTSMHT